MSRRSTIFAITLILMLVCYFFIWNSITFLERWYPDSTYSSLEEEAVRMFNDYNFSNYGIQKNYTTENGYIFKITYKDSRNVTFKIRDEKNIAEVKAMIDFSSNSINISRDFPLKRFNSIKVYLSMIATMSIILSIIFFSKFPNTANKESVT